MRSRATVQSPAGFAAINLTRAGIRARLADAGYRYQISPAETAYGLVDADLTFGLDEGDIRRYGAGVDGVTDDRDAIMTAYGVFRNGGHAPILPPGSSYVSRDGANAWALLFDDDVIFDGGGKFTLIADDDDYNIIRCEGGADVDVLIRGIRFDHGAATPAAAATDHTCVRMESSYNTARLENLDFMDYEADGIYFRADVNGPGVVIKKCTAKNAGRSLLTIAKGENITVERCDAINVGLQAFQTAPAANTTVLRNIDFVGCTVRGGGDYGGAFATTDRAAFYIGGVSGADPDVQGGVRVIDCRATDYGNAAPGTVPLAMGIETREIFAPVVQNFFARGCRDAGLYSYLTDSAVYRGCHSTGNDKGLWMNDCTNYTEENNTCRGNTTKDRDYNGPDGATTYLAAEGMGKILARGSVSYLGGGGAPSLNSKFNASIARRGAAPAGDFDITFSEPAGNANYSVIATFRGHTAAVGGLIHSASHLVTGFRLQTYNAGSLSDQTFDFIVIGVPDSTTEAN